ncbi:MAG: PilZ domain-containing protein [Gammaproteobacteria bacterium]|nr:PilZ domain-containing protein [Gammaproteobacteria bacterium]
MAVDREYEEKRDFIRMFVDAKVEVTDPQSGDTFQGESKDLSAGGVAFVCDHELATGTRLEVKVSSAESKLPPLKADFIVTRCDKQSDNRYEIAGTIENVS